jgi:phosphosulfolactate synthase
LIQPSRAHLQVEIGAARAGESPSLLELLGTSERTAKPRATGLTIVLDKGLGLGQIADLVGVSGAHCDYAKIAWGSALITGNLSAKIDAYRRAGVTPLLGGTLFEYAYLRDRVPALLALAIELDIHVEISDGVIDLPRADKLRWIEEFAKHVEVFSEIGGKFVEKTCDWTQCIREDFSAGATKVVIEGREIGPAGKDIRGDLVDHVLAAAGSDDLVFEALERKQQVWLIQHVGENVNLGNVLPEDVLTLESFRLGLKAHTLLHAFEKGSAP